jgi:hypothetical protein
MLDQKRVQREQSIAEGLDKISIIIGSKCRVIPFGYSPRLVFADICLLLLLVSLWCSRENWRILETLAAKYLRSLAGCGGFARVELETSPECPSTDSPHADPHLCRVMAAEERGDARRQSSEAS